MIDLGLIDRDPDHADRHHDRDDRYGRDNRRDAPPRWWRTARPDRRWWPAAALALAVLASTSAASPDTTGLRPAFQVPTDQVTAVALAGTTLYLVTGFPTSPQVEIPEWTLSAYRLSDGARRWRVPVEMGNRPNAVRLTVRDGTPLLTGWRHLQLPEQPPAAVDGLTTAYDRDTGEPHWTQPGFPAGGADGAVVLDQVRYEGLIPAPADYTATTVDLDTGAAAGTHRLPLGDGVHAISDDGRYLATLRRDGQLAVRDITTDAPAATALAAASWREASLVITDGLLQVSTSRDRERTLSGYDLDPLARRWTLPPVSATASLTPCGPVLCLDAPDGLTAFDPATGAPRWEADRWTGSERWTSAGPVGPPWPEGLLQVHQQRADAEPDTMLVDAATGRPALTLGAWRPFDGGRYPYPVVFQRAVGAFQPGHPEYDPGRLWLARVDPDLAEIEVLGSVDDARSCELGRHHLACVTTHQRVDVWRVR